ncbi:hypothetical protein MIND_00427100 [Mycena indigotica]|uniref:Uncharacterized protein n=1 Tax=Mycena indigotica TaxID=2126181 RepID=A0A8H6W5B9_9AGAR|nr:uncharacterized protein MIND_00427100 [Mycena indigotica]KAF7306359.1 hypothetical protein MIND_00427100 [Mycena indigotica]
MVSDADPLAALKYKPNDVSCASYVLQLRTVFPASQPAPPTSDGSWRTHALSLEKEMVDLKQKYDAERIKSAGILSQPSSSTEPPSSNPSTTTTKKKPKKKSSDKTNSARPKLESIQVEIATIPGSASLFSSLSSFQQLTTSLNIDETTPAQRSLLLRTTQLVISGMADFLQPILTSATSTVASQSTTLLRFSDLMSQLLSTTLPILIRKPTTVSTLMNKLLDCMISSIFTPITQSFIPLCDHFLSDLFPLRPTESIPADLRPAVLQLFQSSFTSLVSIPSAFQHNLRNSLALTTVTQLQTLFPAPASAKTHVSRVRSLARKDAVSYLCTTLHLLFASPACFPVPVTTPEEAPNSFEQRITDGLTKIVRQCRVPANEANSGAEIVDEVEHGMVLGVLEQYWKYSSTVQ